MLEIEVRLVNVGLRFTHFDLGWVFAIGRVCHLLGDERLYSRYFILCQVTFCWLYGIITFISFFDELFVAFIVTR